MAKVALPLDRSWQDVARSYARALRDAFAEVGWQAISVRRLMPAVQGPATLVAVERVLEALVGAGFDIPRAREALTLIADTGSAAGLAAVMLAEYETHPKVPSLIRALDAAPDRELPLLREVVAGRDDSDQLEFQLDVILAGLEQLLPSSGEESARNPPES
nr:TetR/AcrR family transcriptional regulator C-terminal domain-containing protein [Nocardia bovistercoris]